MVMSGERKMMMLLTPGGKNDDVAFDDVKHLCATKCPQESPTKKTGNDRARANSLFKLSWRVPSTFTGKNFTLDTFFGETNLGEPG